MAGILAGTWPMRTRRQMSTSSLERTSRHNITPTLQALQHQPVYTTLQAVGSLAPVSAGPLPSAD